MNPQLYTTPQLESIITFAQTQLRNRFDNTPSDFEAITIIEEARLFGFNTLGEEMINDLATSQDNMSEKFIRDLIARHEQKQHREYNPDERDTYPLPTELKEKRA